MSITTRYRLLFSGDYEDVEYGQAVLTVDGTRYGVPMPPPATALRSPGLAQFIGDGNGGPESDTGWQQTTLNIPLSAGNHTLTLGAFNNQSSTPSEFTEVWFDDVVITGPGRRTRSRVSTIPTPIATPCTAVLVNSLRMARCPLHRMEISFTRPPANFHGDDSFTYRASDGTTTSNLATVTINVGRRSTTRRLRTTIITRLRPGRR